MTIKEIMKKIIKNKYINKEQKKASPEVVEMRKKELEEATRIAENKYCEIERYLKEYQSFGARR